MSPFEPTEQPEPMHATRKNTIATTLREAADTRPVIDWLHELTAMLGKGQTLTTLPDLWVYARDRAPFATYHVRGSVLPATLPTAVVCPHTYEELQAVVRFARMKRIPLIPYGAGSGVLGGTLPLENELMVDLKHFNRILDLDEVNGTVSVQAGMNGGQFEEALNERGYTCGHLPQSIYMSTVGGWAACRGAGQNSTRFGKIEDIVIGLSAVLPDGSNLTVRPVARRAVGPSIKDILIGSEGSFGILIELTLRIWRLPQRREGVVLAFPTLQMGLDALRMTMQAELRPAVARFYDLEESSQRTKGLPEFAQRPYLAILEFSGSPRMVETERDLTLEIVAANDGVRAAAAPYEHWLAHRFESYSPQWQARGYYMDTIEVTGPWSQLPAMYERIRSEVLALGDNIHFGTHFSHIYPEGACQYMTIRLPPMPLTDGMLLHQLAWDKAQRICLELGGSISHHHGVGLLRNRWMPLELGSGLAMLQGLKDHLDPDNLFVPGKLGLRSRPGALDIEARRQG